MCGFHFFRTKSESPGVNKDIIMLPVIWGVIRTYAPIVTLPIAAVAGVLGYFLEGAVSDKYTPYKKSIEEQREDRMLEELSTSSGKVDKLEEKKFVPSNVFERNLSPQLRTESKK